VPTVNDPSDITVPLFGFEVGLLEPDDPSGD
jgi:hypothetical protein